MKRILVICLVAAAAIASGCAGVMNTAFLIEPMEHRVKVERDVMVPMDDGTLLATDLYRPRGVESGPVILVRTPYGKSGGEGLGRLQTSLYRMFAGHGYTVAVQDCRGRGNSQGEFYPFLFEVEDGRATLEWAATAPWSNGRVGSWGGSYFGFTQWAMADSSPELMAMVPLVTGADIIRIMYEGGAINFMNMLGWSTLNAGRGEEPVSLEQVEAGLRHLPLIESDDVVINKTVEFYDDTATYKLVERFEPISYQGRYSEVSAPALSIGGWYDLFQKYQIEDFMTIRQSALEPARSKSRLIIGPWGHGIFADPPVKFKHGGILEMVRPDRMLDFFDAWLKGEDTGADEWPPYYMYVMGANEWRGFEQWPPPGMEPTAWYFHSEGGANTRDGDGLLGPAAPGHEASDVFLYDPADPVLTAGGPLLGPDLGPKDQASVEERPDVLVYTSPPLERPLTVMGPVTVTLYAASDGKDTDFTARLCDVFPKGLSVNIGDGIIRARFRNGDLTSPELIEPGRVYEYTIDLWHTAYVFQPGHRIRVQISSSNFPRFDRNPNTGGDIATGSEMRTARQTVHHDVERPSHVTLPVVP